MFQTIYPWNLYLYVFLRFLLKIYSSIEYICTWPNDLFMILGQEEEEGKV